MTKPFVDTPTAFGPLLQRDILTNDNVRRCPKGASFLLLSQQIYALGLCEEDDHSFYSAISILLHSLRLVLLLSSLLLLSLLLQYSPYLFSRIAI